MLFIDPSYAGVCFIGFAIGESLGAAVLRIAGGIFTKIAFNIKEDDARNPGVIADCAGDNAGDSVGPTADGFETYGVTGVALITFIILAVHDPVFQAQLLIWITSAVSISSTFWVSYLLIPDVGDGSIWWKLAAIVTCGTAAGAVILEVVKRFTSTESLQVENIYHASKKGHNGTRPRWLGTRSGILSRTRLPSPLTL